MTPKVSKAIGQNRLTQVVGGDITTDCVYGSNGLGRRSTVGTTSKNYMLDGLGSVLGEVDSSGSITASRNYMGLDPETGNRIMQ